jgi:hypothetical protein
LREKLKAFLDLWGSFKGSLHVFHTVLINAVIAAWCYGSVPTRKNDAAQFPTPQYTVEFGNVITLQFFKT